MADQQSQQVPQLIWSEQAIVWWAAAVIGAASLQGLHVRFGAALSGSVWCRLACGVSVGSLLFVLACWLPSATRLASRTARRSGYALSHLNEPSFRHLAVAWVLWVLAIVISAGFGDQRWLGLRAGAEAVAIAAAFVGLCLAFVDLERTRLARAVLQGVYLAILALALLGALEMIAPRLELFELARSESSRSIFPRIAGVMLWPNTHGLMMVVGLVIGHGLYQRRSPATSAALAQCLLLTQLAASGSRNAWACFAVAGLVLLVLGLSRVRVVVGTVIFVALVLTLPVSARQAGLQGPLLPTLTEWVPSTALSASEFDALAMKDDFRSHGIGTPEANSLAVSTGGRARLWRAALDTVRDNPLTGIGAGAFASTVSQPLTARYGLNAHSLPLNIAAETGILGVLSILLVVVTFLRPFATRSTAETAPDRIELSLWLSLGVLTMAQLFDCLTYDRVVSSTWVLLAALAWSLRTQRGRNLRPEPTASNHSTQ